MKKIKILSKFSIWALIITLFFFANHVFALTPTSRIAKQDLKIKWKKNNRADVIRSIVPNQKVNFGKPWKYKAGYERRKVVWKYSFPFEMRIQRRNQPITALVDVVYKKVGSGSWRFSYLSIGKLIRKPGKSIKEISSNTGLYFKNLLLKKKYKFNTRYSNNMPWPLKNITKIDATQVNYRKQSKGRYKISYDVTFDGIDKNNKKWQCKNLSITTFYKPKRSNKWYVLINSARNCYAK